MVTLLLPVVMIPVVVPPSVPEPDALDSVIVVSVVTPLGAPPASCDCTVTLKGVPTVPTVGTDV